MGVHRTSGYKKLKCYYNMVVCTVATVRTSDSGSRVLLTNSSMSHLEVVILKRDYKAKQVS